MLPRPVRPPPALAIQVVQGPGGAGVTGEHVVITNTGDEAARLDGFVLPDAALKRLHRFALPTFTLAPGASVRVWTGRGK